MPPTSPPAPEDLLRLTDEDNNALRLIVIVPWELPGTWQTWSELFEPGPVVVSTRVGLPVTYGAQRRLLRDPVHRRLLSPDVRRHLVYDKTAHVHRRARGRLAADGQAEFHAFAWDVLLLEEQEEQKDTGRGRRTRVLLAIHLTTSRPHSPHVQAWTRGLLHTATGHAELEREIRRVLTARSRQEQVGHGLGAVADDGSPACDPYAIVYVPQAQGVGAFPATRGTEPAGLRAAWQWAQLPRRDADALFDAEPLESRLAHLHRFSPTWCAWAGDRVCSVIQVRQDHFRPLVHLEGRFIEAVLLMLLQRHRASSLMTRLAELQPEAAERIDDVIELDTEAVAFVVTEQWTTMTESDRQLNDFLSYLLETYRVPLQVEEARDQAHRLRENVLMRIRRAEQQAEEERARSTRGMEVALGFLTFVGMPLTVFLEVWANWEAVAGIGKRSSALGDLALPWALILITGLAGSVLGGWVLWRLAQRVSRRLSAGPQRRALTDSRGA